MRKISSFPLWLGNAGDLRDLPTLYETGVAAIIDLAADEPVSSFGRDLLYFRLPIVDGSGNARDLLGLILESLQSLLQKQIPTLVVCSAGMSRTPAVVAATLAMMRNTPLDDTLAEIVSGYPCDVSPDLWDDLKEVLLMN